jgi:hypothetical protein
MPALLVEDVDMKAEELHAAFAIATTMLDAGVPCRAVADMLGNGGCPGSRILDRFSLNRF